MSRSRIQSGELKSVFIGSAIDHLRRARDLLAAAGASRSAGRVRKVLKSADGARRHAERLSSNEIGGAP